MQVKPTSPLSSLSHPCCAPAISQPLVNLCSSISHELYCTAQASGISMHASTPQRWVYRWPPNSCVDVASQQSVRTSCARCTRCQRMTHVLKYGCARTEDCTSRHMQTVDNDSSSGQNLVPSTEVSKRSRTGPAPSGNGWLHAEGIISSACSINNAASTKKSICMRVSPPQAEQ